MGPPFLYIPVFKNPNLTILTPWLVYADRALLRRLEGTFSWRSMIVSHLLHSGQRHFATAYTFFLTCLPVWSWFEGEELIKDEKNNTIRQWFAYSKSDPETIESLYNETAEEFSGEGVNPFAITSVFNGFLASFEDQNLALKVSKARFDSVTKTINSMSRDATEAKKAEISNLSKLQGNSAEDTG